MNYKKLILIILLYSCAYAQSPHGENFRMECSQCHNSESWRIKGAVSFDHSTTKFQLIGQHRSASCSDCHKSLRFDNAKSNCIDCHLDRHQNSVGNDCARCHDNNSWLVPNTTQLHQQSRFPLLGKHASADCNQCHQNIASLRFEPIDAQCFACHQTDYNSAVNPNHKLSNFSTNCLDCHSLTESSWSGAGFNHSFFPLMGGHQVTNCYACHSQNNFAGLSSDCYACHQTAYQNSANPKHQLAGFSTTCTQCHSINGWSPSSFNHSTTGFTLTGAHTSQTCNSCHSNGFASTQSECASCHQTKYNNTTNPNHLAANFPMQCEQCHSTTAWLPASFDHDNLYFPIYSGKHKNKWNNCNECHTTPSNYSQFSCINCHEHNRADMDGEHQGVNGYVYESAACLSCHPSGNSDGAVNHIDTQFPLSGQHTALSCNSCHNTSQLISIECSGCHNSNFINAANPNHRQIGLSSNCKDCHTSDGWSPSSFQHSKTKFLLVGNHLNANCGDCHQGATAGISSICYDCHDDDYAASSNPDHEAAGISVDCKSCHNSAAWTPSTFQHSITSFPLIGSHLNANCGDCHQGATTGTSSICKDCHNDAFINSQNPNHTAVGISVDCKLCHDSNAWIPSTFQHSTTSFPLSGSHLSAGCSDCHQGATAGTSSICNDCHNDDYIASINPNHSALSIPVTCNDCHTTAQDWKPATFSIHNNYYPLLGAHASISADCATCHNGNYVSTPNLCVDCHITDYNSATNPNHVAAQFPHACESCHSQNGWTPSTFNHDQQWFPVYSGKHRNKWSACSQCHPNASNYSEFTCVSCHEHRKSKMDSEHQGISGYVYLSPACLNCHPDGDSYGHSLKKLYSE